ncbi:MAG: hypothetical protein HC849_31940 [Oscillatoriales cyanobacterium RU_3_3]|nr:hypothetical protein [Oscillatoriales cyanobacterium RU_3_3]
MGGVSRARAISGETPHHSSTAASRRAMNRFWLGDSLRDSFASRVLKMRNHSIWDLRF